MPRNGMKVVKAGEDLNELYDQLSQDGKDNWDEIGSLGYKPEKTNGVFFARKQSEPKADPIGPSESLSALVTMVKEASAQNDTSSEDENNAVDESADNPSNRLPGMQEPEIDDLDRQHDRCMQARDKKLAANAALKDEEDIMRQKMVNHGRLRYTRNGWTITRTAPEKLAYQKTENKNKGSKKGSDPQGDLLAA